MAKTVKRCKCSVGMRELARERDACRMTTAVVYWCPRCGRLCRMTEKLVDDELGVEWKDVEEWHEPTCQFVARKKVDQTAMERLEREMEAAREEHSPTGLSASLDLAKEKGAR